MLHKINRKNCLIKYHTFPLRWYDELKEEEEYYSPKTFATYNLTLRSKSFKGHLNSLGTELAKLIKQLGSDSLIFLGDTDLPWLNQRSEYRPVKQAELYLVENGVGKRFNGALQVDLGELPTFIRQVGWLIRCNAALPYFHFVDTRENILGFICQYGNVHLYTLNKQTAPVIEPLILRSKFEYLNDNCTESFSKTGSIRGRAIKL